MKENCYPIPIDADGFLECNEDSQLNHEIVQIGIHTLMQQNGLIMRVLINDKSQNERRIIADRWNQLGQAHNRKITKAMERYISRHKQKNQK